MNVVQRGTIARTVLRAVLPAVLIAGGAVGGGPTVFAQGAGAGAAQCSPVATGLTQPRFVLAADNGTVYVTEAGTGGNQTLSVPPTGGPPATRGQTGQITRIMPNGTKSVLAGNLPSYGTAEGGAGPSGITMVGNSLYVAIGAGNAANGVTPPLQNQSSVVRVNPSTGAVAQVADIGAYENANNPDKFAQESNLYGIGHDASGTLYVADAGGNTLYKVNPNTGQLSLVTVFPGITLPPGAVFPPEGNPGRNGAKELDPVPTGVAVGPDGTVYVSLLSGAPFPQGASKIVKVAPDGTISNVVTGLTMATGLTVGPDRNLYVSEISTNFNVTTTPPQVAPGRVLRVLPNGTLQLVAGNLPAPNGLDFDRNGNLYVVTNASFTPPPAGPQGQVLRCVRVAAPAAVLPRTGSPLNPAFKLPFTLAASVVGSLATLGAGLFLTRHRA